MSANPFLRDRFRFKDQDNVTSDKDKNNLKKYNPKNNSFTKSRDNRDNRDRDRDRDNRDRDRDRDRDKINRTNDRNDFKETPNDNSVIITEEAFPSLSSTPMSTTKQTTYFKDALEKHTEVDECQGLKRGWVEISKNTKFQHSITEEEEEDPNIQMAKIVETLQEKWLQNRITYDNINGEGAYDDLHYLSPIYGSDYESDCDSNCDNDFTINDDICGYSEE